MKSTKTNLFIGSKVLIDWPIRWRGAAMEHQARCKEDATKEECFGKTGIIMSNVPDKDRARDYQVRLDETGEIVSLFYGALTVTELPPKDRTEELLEAILAELKTRELA